MKDLERFSEQVLTVNIKIITMNHSISIILGIQKIIISENNINQRIDNFLLRVCIGVPKSHIYRILRSGEVRVNKSRIDQTYRLKNNDVVRIPPMHVTQKKNSIIIPHVKFQILLEDAHLLAIIKPVGLAVHGGSGINYGVIEQLRALRPEAKFLELVHRLDRDTSGILLLAKKRSALINLHEQIRNGHIDKRYLTLVHGDWKNARQHVKLSLRKYNTPTHGHRVSVQKDGQASHTIFSLIRRYGKFTLLEAKLQTGRTHQIRVHLSAIGFPIVGDKKYGNFPVDYILQDSIDGIYARFKRMFLHAHQITFTHPDHGKKITLKSDLSTECLSLLRSLEIKNEIK